MCLAQIHHFIPREFSNDFEKSIEVIENYVSLCQSCHKLIHLGVDRERKMAINQLFKKREAALKSKGLNITLDKIKEYYGIKE